MKVLKRTGVIALFSAIALTALSGCKAQETFDAKKATFDIDLLYAQEWTIPSPNAALPYLAKLQFKNDGFAVFTEADGDADFLLYTVNGQRLNLYEMDDDTMKREELEASFDVVSISPESLQLKVVNAMSFDLDDDLGRLISKNEVLSLLPAAAAAAVPVVEGVSGATFPKTMPAEEAAFDASKSTLANISDLYKSWELISVEKEGKMMTVREAKIYTFDDQGNFSEFEPRENETDRYRYSIHKDEIAVFEIDDRELEDIYRVTKLTADELQLRYLLKDATKADRDDRRKADMLLNFKKK